MLLGTFEFEHCCVDLEDSNLKIVSAHLRLEFDLAHCRSSRDSLCHQPTKGLARDVDGLGEFHHELHGRHVETANGTRIFNPDIPGEPNIS